MFANNLSVNPFAIDPAKAVYTLTFVCVLLFILLVGCTYMYQKQVRDFKEFEEEFKIKYRAGNAFIHFHDVFFSMFSNVFFLINKFYSVFIFCFNK